MKSLLGGVLAALWMPRFALACGGFFCDQAASPDPPVQASERIIFVKEPDHTTALVQITWQGDPVDFAWVVPVPARPTLGTSDPVLFDELDAATAPTFRFLYEDRVVTQADAGDDGGGCSGGGGGGGTVTTTTDAEQWGDDVQVVGTENVGPYETTTLTADEPGALVAWLRGNGYGIPAAADPVLRDYVARGHYFVALKLRPQADVTALEPLSVRYAGSEPCIPLRITSISSAPLLAITAFVVGDGRAMPRNYNHVRPDYDLVRPGGLSGRTDYSYYADDAVQRGGGRAFITEAAMPAARLRANLTADSTRALLPDGRYVTRLFTRITPEDMTLDPEFELRQGQPDVSNVHTVDLRGDSTYARVTVAGGESSGLAHAPLGLLVLMGALRRRRR
jgi:MYXO-CTERM domain-containing protein